MKETCVHLCLPAVPPSALLDVSPEGQERVIFLNLFKGLYLGKKCLYLVSCAGKFLVYNGDFNIHHPSGHTSVKLQWWNAYWVCRFPVSLSLGFMVRLKVAHVFTSIQYTINITQKEAQNLFQIYVVNNVLSASLISCSSVVLGQISDSASSLWML